MKRVVLLLIIVSMYAGCESDETRMSRIADDYCNCFSAVNDVVSPETVKIYEEMLKANNDRAFEDGLSKLDSATRMKATREFTRMEEIMEEETQGHQCLVKLESKHRFSYGLESADKLKELIELLEARSECRVATLFLRIAVYAAPRKN